jgi:hypothetical protein
VPQKLIKRWILNSSGPSRLCSSTKGNSYPFKRDSATKNNQKIDILNSLGHSRLCSSTKNSYFLKGQ